MSDFLAPQSDVPVATPEEIRARRLASFNDGRANRGQPPLTDAQFRRRAELEGVYRDPPSAAAQAMAAEEMARQDRSAGEPPPASPETAAAHIRRIRVQLSPLRLVPPRNQPEIEAEEPMPRREWAS